MKKLIFALCVCAGLCACSSDDDLVSSSSSNDLGQATAYLKVNIKDVNSLTRATSGGNAYGTTEEQTVNNAYFYFYDDEGNYMAKGSVANIEGTPASGDPNGNVEWNSGTVVAVWGLSGTFPTQMLTVLNKPTGIDFTNQSLTTALATLAGTPYGETGNFVMSTSVYEAGEPTAVVNTTALTDANFRTEPVALETDYPEGEGVVDVYVERLAAKVGVSVASSVYGTGTNEASYNLIPLLTSSVNSPLWEEWAKPLPTATHTGYYIQLQGWNVDCVARDAYVSKHVDTSWSLFAGTDNPWNAAGSYRSYWAESPNYDVEHAYPTTNINSATGIANTDATEETSPLDEYLRYVSLNGDNALAFGNTAYAYCGENTNTVGEDGIIQDATGSGLTNMIVRAQLVDFDANGVQQPIGVDFVKYHGEFIPLDSFEIDMINEVMAYDIRTLSQEVAEALEDEYKDNILVSGFIKDLAEAIEGDVVYMKKTSETTANYEVFDARFLQLIDKGDGKVGIWFNTTTSSDIEGNVHYPTSETKGHPIPSFYDSPILKEAADDMDDYTFAFKLDVTKLTEGELTILSTIGLNDDGYLPLGTSTSIYIETQGGNKYSLAQYFIRAIEREAAGINDDWEDAGYPYFYNQGYMYYNIPIEHLAVNSSSDTIVEGQYGVVRNHWYDITVNSVSNFGHAISNLESVIVPQPEEDYYYMGADINILSWHMVEQSVAW